MTSIEIDDIVTELAHRLELRVEKVICPFGKTRIRVSLWLGNKELSSDYVDIDLPHFLKEA